MFGDVARHFRDARLVQGPLRAQLRGKAVKNFCNLARLALVQTLQLVIRVDRLERFDESRLARRRVAMCHALNPSAMVRFDWNHETIVADRDELILNRFGRALQVTTMIVQMAGCKIS